MTTCSACRGTGGDAVECDVCMGTGKGIAWSDDGPSYCIHLNRVDGVCVDCKLRLPRVTVVEGGE